MKHKGLIFGVALGLAAIVFFLLWLLSLWLQFSLWLAAFFALFIFSLCVFLAGSAYWRSTAVLNMLCRVYAREQILYADIASLIEKQHEYTGALVVTRRRILFETPKNMLGASQHMDYLFSEVAMVRNQRDFFWMGAGGKDNRFKVFQCDFLVKTIQACIAEGQAKQEPDAPFGKKASPAPRGAKKTTAALPLGETVLTLDETILLQNVPGSKAAATQTGATLPLNENVLPQEQHTTQKKAEVQPNATLEAFSNVSQHKSALYSDEHATQNTSQST